MARTKVATRPKKLTARQLKAFREDLERKRVELLDLYRHDLEVGQSASDEGTEDLVDRANKSYNQELMFVLSDTERDVVFQIDEALTRLDKGSFGICENCAAEIGLPRLEAVPWARFCVKCQEQEEMGLLDA